MEGVSLWFDKTKQAQSVGFPHKAFSLHRQGPPGRKTIPDSSIDREKSNIAAFVTNSSFSEHHPENTIGSMVDSRTPEMHRDLWWNRRLQSRLILFQTSIAQDMNAKIQFSQEWGSDASDSSVFVANWPNQMYLIIFHAENTNLEAFQGCTLRWSRSYSIGNLSGTRFATVLWRLGG